ncbi:MAG: hypothetical protein HYT69_01585 [Candidatus Zambryskibacteria bacterium]|nr:hypothetical protein [Candidatus Zambryskibacteria bacterium]
MSIQIEYETDKESDSAPVQKDKEKLLPQDGSAVAKNFINYDQRQENRHSKVVGKAFFSRRLRTKNFQNKNEHNQCRYEKQALKRVG